MIDIPENIPAEILARSVSLEKLGINGSAWNLHDTELVLNLLQEAGYCVLGGDIYLRTSVDELKPTYDNWYYEPVDNGIEDSTHSVKLALSKIRKYKERNDAENLFVDLVTKRLN